MNGGNQMKKTVFLLVTLFFCAALRADLLDDVARQLDLLEKEYWQAQRSSDGDYHRAVKTRLWKLRSNVGRIFTQLQKLRKHHRYHFDEALNVLCGNFGRIKPSVVQAFRFNMKSTSMSDYTRDFREFLREKEEAAEGDDDKKSRRSRKRSKKVFPTLSNVDIVEYERWLADRTAANLESFSKSNSRFWNSRSKTRYKGFASNEAEKVHNYVSLYQDAIKKIRLDLVKVRQQIKMEFK